MEQKKRLTQIGNIRALAILLVVFGHSIILYSQAWDLYETDWQVPFLNWLKELIDLHQMPLFFSLSGYLFVFTHEKKKGFWNLLKNKTLRLIVPYLGIGICFLLPIRMLIGFPGYQNSGVSDILRKFVCSSDVGHLWFLPALFITFLLSELILALAESIPVIKRYPEVFLCITACGLYLEGYRIGFGYAPLLAVYMYLLWFSLGYAIHKWQRLFRYVCSFRAIKWLLLIMCLLAHIWWGISGSARVLLSLSLKLLFILSVYAMMPEKTCDVVEKVDRNSFGIYLFHSPMIYLTFSIMPNANPIIVIVINLFLFGAIAYALTAWIRKTKLKVFIGE